MKDIKKIIAEKLTEREQIIINLRYGLTGEPPMPQREVAKRLNISRSYISRIEVKALQIIRETAIIKGINP